LPAQNTHSKKTCSTPAITGADILKFPLISDISFNPATAGVLEKPHIAYQLHSQWLNMENFPVSSSSQFDMAGGKNNRYGGGILINRYQFGTKETYTVDLALSVKFDLGKQHSLRWGISVVSFNKNVQNTDRTGRIYEDMINIFLGPKYPTFEKKHMYHENYFDLKTGVWLNHKNYFAGLSLNHLKQISYGSENQVENIENLSPAPLPVEIQFDAGYQFNPGGIISIIPMLRANGSFDQKINYSPALHFCFSNKILAGFTYYDMNVAAVNLGFRAYDHLHVIVTAGMPVQDDLKRISSFALFEGGIGYIF
jgi:type IX secretion system PorP/SprF family membrane protein